MFDSLVSSLAVGSEVRVRQHPHQVGTRIEFDPFYNVFWGLVFQSSC